MKEETMIVEVKAGDGGEDARLFADDLDHAISVWMTSDLYRL